MKYITLICAAGMSTSLLVSKMKEVAKNEGKDVQIVATSSSVFANYKEPTDVLLLGPQVSYLLDEMKNKYEPKGMKVDVIDMAAYGMMDGKKVLDAACAMMDEI